MGISISNELKTLLMSGAKQTVTIAVTPTTGEPFTITDEDIMFGTFTIDRTIMEGVALNLGSCVASELTMVLINYDGRFNDIVWNEAEMVVTLGVEGSNETLPMGIFYIYSTPKTRNVIEISALDGMPKFDKSVYNPDLFILDEWTLGDLIDYCCTQCGVTLATDITGLPNTGYDYFCGQSLLDNYAYMHREFTYRNLLSSAVALLGRFAWINEDGELEIGFFSTTYDTTFDTSNRYSSDYDDIIEISGVNFTKSSTGVEYATDVDSKYFFDLTGNYILEYSYEISSGMVDHTIDDVLNNIYDDYASALTYLPMTMETLPCPFIFPLDGVRCETTSNTLVNTYVTSVVFHLNGSTNIASQGISPADKALASVTTVSTLQNSIGALEVGAKSASERITDLENAIAPDHIVEQGTSNGWRYRKWSSGWFEAWHSRDGADIPANQSMVECTFNLPFTIPSNGLFAITFGSYQNTTSVSNACIWDVASYTTTSLIVRTFRNYTDTAGWAISPRCCIYIQGVWK